jgi:hypothetical protein
MGLLGLLQRYLYFFSFYLYSHFSDLGRFFSFLILCTVRRTPWMRDKPVARPLPTQRTQKHNKRTQTTVPWVGFEPKIPALELANTVHASDRMATVTGYPKSKKKKVTQTDRKLFPRWLMTLNIVLICEILQHTMPSLNFSSLLIVPTLHEPRRWYSVVT